MPQAALPLLAKIWFLVVAPVVILDAIFVLTRAKSVNLPHPLAEVVPFRYWAIYARYDRRYAANDDPFVVVQSWLNLVEVAMGLFVTLLAICDAQNLAIKLAIVVCLMTLYKTVFYCLIEIAEGGKHTRHNTVSEKLTMLIAPLSVWILVPSLILRQCFRALAVASVPGSFKPKATVSQHYQQQKHHGNNNNQGKKKN
ncbi:conserved hypothetical protein [Leishmania infantum JPCM5]|uniref:Emopamil_binding_protein_-_putative n=2 Tax=Leishmania infantum TaxID=5671 RepID=A0A6L0XGM6_LEIIN|nr:conserved hypothetical protein [Leishmania infantum JPCM5]CAC9499470.1 Emopamil_binding_protein_-_putative [Leishmania infantum]CAM69058.1 conserved hypothetical protein [Leishmania infantum JPCM5]SUZ42994.1 Emopamil_binding_protein_-_putative [Leishmania infantum]|eukprot:XP_001466343.1 conserved hypothetical protein [Leishmania infantum JPCM5]